MGFDIVVVQNGMVVAEEYLSYNWGDLSEVEVPNGESEPIKTDLWYIKKDLFGKSSTEVIEGIDRALDLLRTSFGVVPPVPDFSNSGWGWGVHHIVDGFGNSKSELLPFKERLGVLAFHLGRFRSLAKRYITAVFYDSDTYHEDHSESKIRGVLHAESKIRGVLHAEQEPPVEPLVGDPYRHPGNGAVLAMGYPYRHPYNGLIVVDTFSKAMEIYGLEMAQGTAEIVARRWFDVAWTLPGRPPIPDRV